MGSPDPGQAGVHVSPENVPAHRLLAGSTCVKALGQVSQKTVELTGRSPALFSPGLDGEASISFGEEYGQPAAETLAAREISPAVEIMCISISRSVVADISKYHYIHHYLEITAVIRPATRLTAHNCSLPVDRQPCNATGPG